MIASRSDEIEDKKINRSEFRSRRVAGIRVRRVQVIKSTSAKVKKTEISTPNI